MCCGNQGQYWGYGNPRIIVNCYITRDEALESLERLKSSLQEELNAVEKRMKKMEEKAG